MTARVEIRRRFRDWGTAECEDRLPPQCTRERARQHVKEHGHIVRFVITDTTIYQPEGTS
jgi:hypothetical protein